MPINRKKLSQKKWDKLVSIGKAAGKVFIQKGYLETSLEDIAAAIGMSKGALYYYFPSKVEILYFIISTHGDRVLGDLEKELKQINDCFSKIRFFISRHIRLYIESMDESKIFVNEKNYLSPKYFKTVKENEKKYYQIAHGIIADCLGDRVTKGELTALTFSLFGMLTWTYSWYDPQGVVTPQELSEIIYGIFAKGVSRYLDSPSRAIGRANQVPDE